MAERLKCYGCCNLDQRTDGDGGRSFYCLLVPGMVVGSINLAEYDEPFEVNRCHSSRRGFTRLQDGGQTDD